MNFVSNLVLGYVLNSVEKQILASLSSASNGNNASYFAWNNDNFIDTLNNKYNSFYELAYKHDCNNPQVVYDNIKNKLYQLDLVNADMGSVYKKGVKIETNDIVAISWNTNLNILPFTVYSNVFYNIINVYETENYINLIIRSTANSFNDECISFTLTKDAQSVSIHMTYNYTPLNVYYSFLVLTKILEYDTVINQFMVNVVSHLYGDEKTTCDTKNVKSLMRTIV
jgi:hypothetical protein